jgi:hypothetical protein
MPTRIVAGDATAGTSVESSSDGALALKVGPVGTKVDALTLAANGQLGLASQITGTTVGAAGAAAALPATPLGYLTMTLNGATVRVPYYN